MAPIQPRFTVAQVLALPSAMLEADASGSLIAAAVTVAPSVVAQPAARIHHEQPAAQVQDRLRGPVVGGRGPCAAGSED